MTAPSVLLRMGCFRQMW